MSQYQDYLTRWQEHFGDAKQGEYGYYQRGKRQLVFVKHLSEVEFQDHLAALEVIYVTDAMLGEADFQQALPYEMALLF